MPISLACLNFSSLGGGCLVVWLFALGGVFGFGVCLFVFFIVEVIIPI